jgi:threonine dehydrogenase-like Zn-dependent dehydrogenase
VQAVAVVEPDRIELVEIPAPVPGPYEALIKTEIGYLCNATDRKLVEGHFPGVEQYPLLLGHETVGIVEAVGEKVRSYKVGDRVVGALLLNSTSPDYASAWGGFSEAIVAGDNAAMIEDGVADDEHSYADVFAIMRVVPDWVPVEAAGLLCTWREVYAAFEDFKLQPGDDILVFGAGPVGLSFVKFARLRGMGYIGVVEPLDAKRAKALEMGADETFVPGDAALDGLAAKRGKPLDAVIDAVGRESIINAALPLIKTAGSICVYGVIDTPAITLQKALGPYNFNLLVHQWPTRAYESAAQEPLLEWVQAGKLSHEEFLSAEYPVRDVAAAFEYARTGTPIKTLLRFG